MSIYSHASMTNHHDLGLFAEFRRTLQIWRKRQQDRRQLAEMSARDLHDVGLSWSDVVHEAEKPFWRA